jgi:hypothetical protein
MEIPGYEPFYLETLADLRAEITRLGLSIPVSDSTDSLFQPRQIAGRTVPNAFCAQPIANSPGPLSIRRYQKLADGGFSLIWVTEILGKLDLRDLRSRSEAIFISQLSPCPAAELHDSAVESQLHSLVEDARSAAEAGFDGIDISCHHGTLAAHLLAARKRPGRFGGSLENRMRFVLEAIHRIRDAHPDLILAVRLNAFHACEGGFGVDAEDFRKPDLSEPIALVRALEAAGGTSLPRTPAKAAEGLAPVGVDLAGVELPALLGVAQDVEGGADLLEALLGGGIAGIGVGMVLLGELAEGLPDIVGPGAAGNAEHLVGISRHGVTSAGKRNSL